MKKLFLIIVLIFSIISTITSQTNTFHKREYINKQDTLLYQISFPDNYNNKDKYPLVLFLHGAGERGNDNQKQMMHGSSLFNDTTNRKNFPAIVIFPQCPQESYWVKIIRSGSVFDFGHKEKITEPLYMVERLLKDLINTNQIDKRRIYIMGLSMGGMGTLDLICRNPRLFAAAIPICGGVELERVSKIKDLPVRLYHGGADNVVPPEWSRNIFKELKSLGSDKIEYIEYEGVGHNSWDSAFNSPDFLKWIFNQKRK